MKQGVIEAYEEEQLVVALSDLAVVRGALMQRAIGAAIKERDERLGLALLTLSDVAAGATKLREDDSGLGGARNAGHSARPPASAGRALRPRSHHFLVARILPVRLRRLGSDHWKEPRDRTRQRAPIHRRGR